MGRMQPKRDFSKLIKNSRRTKNPLQQANINVKKSTKLNKRMPNLQKPENNFMAVGEGKKIREKRETAKDLNGLCIRWTAIALKSK